MFYHLRNKNTLGQSPGKAGFMRYINIEFIERKGLQELTLHEIDCLLDGVYDQMDLFESCLIDYVENEEDLLLLTIQSGHVDTYSCAMELLTHYGVDRGKVLFLYNLGLLSNTQMSDIVAMIDSSINFLRKYLRVNAIWKEQ